MYLANGLISGVAFFNFCPFGVERNRVEGVTFT